MTTYRRGAVAAAFAFYTDPDADRAQARAIEYLKDR